MPELPEVETVRRGLAPRVEGRRIVTADIRRPDLRWPFPADMAARLQGARIVSLRRRSKYLLADLDTGETLIVHLGMSGRLQADGDGIAAFALGTGGAPRHDHVVLTFDGGTRVTLNDPRRFGAMDLAPTDAVETHRLLARLGPEPLGNAFGAAYLEAALKSRRTPIKAALLDQRVVAGLGNIYVCEALHRAGIAPARRSDRIAGRRIPPLVRSVREVLVAAIEAGGSSLRDYRQADGALGYFQHDFRVYGRTGQACRTECCDGVVRRMVQSGRSTFHCPRCQR